VHGEVDVFSLAPMGSQAAPGADLDIGSWQL